MNEVWEQVVARSGVELSARQHEQLGQYLELLTEANQRMNLTRITDRAAAEVGHVGDSLTVLAFLPAGEIRLADVGSGGGVPGIPLAIARPQMRVTLIESTKKKAAFLREAVKQLDLSNVTVSDERAEDAGLGDLREEFDVAVARAVATLDWLMEWCLPLVKKGGKVLAMKGPRNVEELAAGQKVARMLGGGEIRVHPVELPGTSGHVIVEVPKVGRTDPDYPRESTMSKGKPLA
jgi:16S rRNA (guanine527-N7)-methyltransferase